MNPWAVAKDRSLKRALVPLAERLGSNCDIAPDDGDDPLAVVLYRPDLPNLRAYVHLHGQRSGTYGVFLEYPHPVPGILETEENLPLPRLLSCLALHFDA